MNKLLIVLLVLLLCVSIRCIGYYVEILALAELHRMKDYPIPTEEEMDECEKKAIANFWKYTFRRRKR